MQTFEILTAPDPRLQEIARPVEKVDSSIRRLMDQLLETMYGRNGVGLAAIQVGIPKRVIAIDLGDRGEASSTPFLMANPELLWVSPTNQTTEEGCLSVPGQFAKIVRPFEIRVSYLDENNQHQELETSGLLADCIQHEIDHLNGILFIEHLSALKRKFILNKLAKEKKYK
jgi:peptide deformylase